jgi:hypothetical protein
VLALCIALAELLSKGRMLPGRVSRRELEEKRDFRANIGEDLREIAEAFKPRTLTILVDDLDRCPPKVVVQLLEAVNFLSTSFDCFVVVGMAREYVERSLVKEFSNQREFLLDDGAAQGEREDEEPAKLQAFAARYLDRLINIEIPLSAKPAEQRMALLAELDPLSDRVESGDMRFALRAFSDFLDTNAARLQLVALVLVSFFVGFIAGDRWSHFFAQAPAFSLGNVGVSWFVAAWYAALAAGLGFAASLAIARLLEPKYLIKDSEDFVGALLIWIPVSNETNPTPQAVKSFITQARYWAIQMAGTGEISEATLMALTALRRIDRRILDQGDIDRGLARFFESDQGEVLRETMSRAIEAHRRQFGDWPPSIDQVKDFLRVVGEI